MFTITGLRRVAAAGRRAGGDQLREGGAAQQRLGAWLRGGGQGQGGAGGRLPRRRLVHRHPRHRRRDLRRAGKDGFGCLFECQIFYHFSSIMDK